MTSRPLFRALFASAAIAASIALGGCNYTDSALLPGRAMAPLSDKMVAELQSKNMDKDSPILVRIFKTEAELEVWKKDRNGEFALLKTYPICRWSGDLGPKTKEGDRQAPEGFYTITPAQMNPNSQFYLAFNMGYPNAYDKALGRTGANLMVHGDCSSRGCYAMSDEQMQEIYALGRESFFGGQKAFQVQAYPFRMTPQNMAKYRNSPHLAFWKMLKQGNDHFEVTRQEPKVDVCEKRYVFDATVPGGKSFSPAGACPNYEVPREIADAVNERKRQDEYKTAQLIAGGTPVAASRAGIDGGMHRSFAAKLQGATTDADGRIVLADSNSSGITTRVGIVPPADVAPDAPAKIAPVTQPAPVQLAAKPAAAKPQTVAAAPSNVGLRGSSKETTVAAASPPQHNVFPPPAPSKPAVAAKPEPAPVPETRTAYAGTPPSSGFLAGAQPAMPAGSFSARWSGMPQ